MGIKAILTDICRKRKFNKRKYVVQKRWANICKRNDKAFFVGKDNKLKTHLLKTLNLEVDTKISGISLDLLREMISSYDNPSEFLINCRIASRRCEDTKYRYFVWPYQTGEIDDEFEHSLSCDMAKFQEIFKDSFVIIHNLEQLLAISGLPDDEYPFFCEDRCSNLLCRVINMFKETGYYSVSDALYYIKECSVYPEDTMVQFHNYLCTITCWFDTLIESIDSSDRVLNTEALNTIKKNVDFCARIKDVLSSHIVHARRFRIGYACTNIGDSK